MDGIINIYKEKGYTSHDVVAKLRGILHQKKIGHTGTLDPDAEGVLPVCLGKATKVCDFLTDKSKTYQAVMLLGLTTDTQDVTGIVQSECPVIFDTQGHSESFTAEVPSSSYFLADNKNPALSQIHCLTEEKVRECINSFIGEQEQIPPMYSAVKVGGKKLYELARQGIEIERAPRRIKIDEIQVHAIRSNITSDTLPDIIPKTESTSAQQDTDRFVPKEFPEIEMTIRCSKGTYIRTLCKDIGDKLGCGGCMKTLLRTQVGSFHVENAKRLDEIETLRDAGNLEQVIFSTDSVFHHMEGVILTPAAEKLVRNGNPLSLEMMEDCFRLKADHFPVLEYGTKKSEIPNNIEEEQTGRLSYEGEQLRVYGMNGEFLAVYSFSVKRHSWRAVKMFLT